MIHLLNHGRNHEGNRSVGAAELTQTRVRSTGQERRQNHPNQLELGERVLVDIAVVSSGLAVARGAQKCTQCCCGTRRPTPRHAFQGTTDGGSSVWPLQFFSLAGRIQRCRRAVTFLSQDGPLFFCLRFFSSCPQESCQCRSCIPEVGVPGQQAPCCADGIAVVPTLEGHQRVIGQCNGFQFLVCICCHQKAFVGFFQLSQRDLAVSQIDQRQC
mmetsp:Transcript_9155/g.32425  ORF Transcript_9155/g.32425 Transcript_9155/m.32425 type:complete len:214 (-) Transcript_9155:543-1184(-)